MRFAPGGRMPGTKRNDEGIYLATRLVFETTEKKVDVVFSQMKCTCTSETKHSA